MATITDRVSPPKDLFCVPTLFQVLHKNHPNRKKEILIGYFVLNLFILFIPLMVDGIIEACTKLSIVNRCNRLIKIIDPKNTLNKSDAALINKINEIKNTKLISDYPEIVKKLNELSNSVCKVQGAPARAYEFSLGQNNDDGYLEDEYKSLSREHHQVQRPRIDSDSDSDSISDEGNQDFNNPFHFTPVSCSDGNN